MKKATKETRWALLRPSVFPFVEHREYNLPASIVPIDSVTQGPFWRLDDQ